MAAFSRVVVAAVLLVAMQGVARSAPLNDPLADWFLVTLTAGPDGAADFEASYQTSGRTTGEPMVSGGAISDGESAGGGVSSAWSSGIRVGLAGAATLSIDVLPPGGAGTFRSSHTIFGDALEPGERVFALSFVSGTLSRSSPVIAKAESGSVSAEMFSGTGSSAILLLDTSDGIAAAEAAVVGGALSATYPIDSPGLVGAFTYCTACLGEWSSPDGRAGDNQTGTDTFAGPSGRWRLSWSGLTDPGTGWATVGGYAPIGEHSRHFPFGPGLLD